MYIYDGIKMKKFKILKLYWILKDEIYKMVYLKICINVYKFD